MNLRVPPHTLNAEGAVLGALLVRADLLADAVGTGLEAGDFYSPAHGHAFAAICRLVERGQPVDALTVSEELTAQGFTEPTFDQLLAFVGERVTSSANTAEYAGRVREPAKLRRFIATLAELSDAAFGPEAKSDVAGFFDHAEAAILAATERPGTLRGGAPVGQVLDEALVELRARAKGERQGLATGFVDFDRVTGGLRPGQLVILAARPSIGKSAFALDIALNVAYRGEGVLVVSLEMGRLELGERVLSRGGVSSERILSGRLDALAFQTLEGFRDRMATAPLVIDDDGASTLLGIRAKARRMAAKGGLALVVVDYLQLVNVEHRERRELAVASVSRGLKQLAGELQVPVLAVAQVNRAVEQRADKRPTLADLRESGSLEQDADLVLVLHREAAYDLAADPGVAELIVRKHRNGPTGTIPLVWLPGRMSFANALKESF